MVVMGWRGRRRNAQTALGSNIDHVMRDAHCDVAVLRGSDFDAVKNILIPISYPDQARLMLDIGEVFSHTQDAKLELFHAVPPGMSDDEREQRLDRLYQGLAEQDEWPDEEHEARRAIDVEETRDVAGAIVERSAGCDLTIIGASREGWYRKVVAGTVPEQIARRVEGRLLLVKHRRSPVHAGLLDTIEFFRSTESGLTPGMEEREKG